MASFLTLSGGSDVFRWPIEVFESACWPHPSCEQVRGNRNIMDPVGWIAEWLEWNTSFYLAAKVGAVGTPL